LGDRGGGRKGQVCSGVQGGGERGWGFSRPASRFICLGGGGEVGFLKGGPFPTGHFFQEIFFFFFCFLLWRGLLIRQGFC